MGNVRPDTKFKFGNGSGRGQCGGCGRGERVGEELVGWNNSEEGCLAEDGGVPINFRRLEILACRFLLLQSIRRSISARH